MLDPVHDIAGLHDPVTAPTVVPRTEHRLRLLSYNIQAGIETRRYRHYLTHSLKHVLPFPERLDNLDRIGGLLRGFDLVGLQEVDAGGLRSGFVNQTKYLASQGQFPYWHDQTNRSLGKIARHSLGLLSRFPALSTHEHHLPGFIPGRGGLVAIFGDRQTPLLVMVLHLALGSRARLRQLAYIRDVVRGYRDVIVMGDFNCGSNSRELRWLLSNADLCEPAQDLHTYPSWDPSRTLDHILLSPGLGVTRTEVLLCRFSDHLPITVDLALPERLWRVAPDVTHRASA